MAYTTEQINQATDLAKNLASESLADEGFRQRHYFMVSKDVWALAYQFKNQDYSAIPSGSPQYSQVRNTLEATPVYGRGSPGAIPQQARIQEAKRVGLPSTATPQQIEAKGGQPSLQYTTSEGKTYVGTKAFLESKAYGDYYKQVMEQERQKQSPEQAFVLANQNQMSMLPGATRDNYVMGAGKFQEQMNLVNAPEIRYYSKGTMKDEPQIVLMPSPPTPKPITTISSATHGGIITQQETYNEPITSKIKTSFGRLINVGTISEEGFKKYTEDIFVPFQSTKVKDYSAEQLITSEKYIPQGTTFESNIGKNVFGESFDINKITPGEFKVLSDIKVGVPYTMIGVPSNVQEQRLTEQASKKAEQIIQEKIDTGKLSYETEEEKAQVTKLAEEQYQIELGKLSGQQQAITKSRELFMRGTYESNPLKTTATIGLIGGTALISIPSIVGYEVATLGTGIIGSYSLGSSSKDLATALNPQLTLKERIVSGLIGTGKVVVGGYLVSTSIASTPTSLLSKWNVRDVLLADLEKYPVRITGKELYGGEQGSMFKISGERAIPSAKQEITYRLTSLRNVAPDIFAPNEFGVPVIIKKGSEKYSLFIKEGTSKVSVYDLISGKTLRGIESFKGGGKIISFGEGVRYIKSQGGIKVGMELKEVSTGAGSFYLTTPKTIGFKSFKFFGGVKDIGEEYKIFGAKPTGIKRVGEGIVTKGKITAFGTIIKEPIISFEEGFIQFKGRGVGTPLSYGKDVFTRLEESAGVITEQQKMLSPKFRTSLVTPVSSITSEAGKTGLKSSIAELTTQKISSRGALGSIGRLGLQQRGQGQTTDTTIKLKEREAFAVINIPSYSYSTRQYYGQTQTQREVLVQKQIQKTIQKPRVPSIPIVPTIPPTTPEIIIPIYYKPKMVTYPKTKTGTYGVSIRRFGKWKPYAQGIGLTRAFKLGEGYTRRTLGASFKIIGKGKIPQAPTGYYGKIEKGEKIFIQKRRYRLSAPSEKREIQIFKKLKGGRRK